MLIPAVAGATLKKPDVYDYACLVRVTENTVIVYKFTDVVPDPIQITHTPAYDESSKKHFHYHREGRMTCVLVKRPYTE